MPLLLLLNYLIPLDSYNFTPRNFLPFFFVLLLFSSLNRRNSNATRNETKRKIEFRLDPRKGRAKLRPCSLPLHSSFTFPLPNPSYSLHYHNAIGRYVTGKTYYRSNFPLASLSRPSLKTWINHVTAPPLMFLNHHTLLPFQ